MRNAVPIGSSKFCVLNAEFGIRNADFFIPRSAFRIPHSAFTKRDGPASSRSRRPCGIGVNGRAVGYARVGARPARRGESKFGCEPTGQFPVFERRRVPSLAVMSNAATVPIAPVARSFTAALAKHRVWRSAVHSRLRRSGKNYKPKVDFSFFFTEVGYADLAGFRLTGQPLAMSDGVKRQPRRFTSVLARRPLPPVRGCPSPTDPL